MSNQKTIVKWVSQTKDTRIIAVPAIFIKAFGYKGAFFIAQCVYWSDKSTSKTARKENTFYKSAEEWEEELGLSYHDITQAVKASKGVIKKSVKKVFGVPTLHWTVDMQKLKKIIEEYGGKREDIPTADYQEVIAEECTDFSNSKNLNFPQKLEKFENHINTRYKMTNTCANAHAEKPSVYLGDEDDLETGSKLTEPLMEEGAPRESVPDLSWLRVEYRPLANRFLRVAGKMYYPNTDSERRLWYRELHIWLKMGAMPEDVEKTIRNMRASRLTIGGVQSLTKMLRETLAQKEYAYDPLVEAGYTRIS